MSLSMTMTFEYDRNKSSFEQFDIDCHELASQYSHSCQFAWGQSMLIAERNAFSFIELF